MNPFNPLFEIPVANDFKASLAHEIRNPLATINLSLELMLSEHKDDALKIYIDIIRNSSEKIKELVDELIKSDCEVESQFANQSVHHLLDEVVEMAKDRIMLKNIMVCKEYDPI